MAMTIKAVEIGEERGANAAMVEQPSPVRPLSTLGCQQGTKSPSDFGEKVAETEFERTRYSRLN